MNPDRESVRDALQACYEKITAATGALGDDELMLPTRCTAGRLPTFSTISC